MAPAVLLDLYDTLAWIDWPTAGARRAQLAERAGVDPACLAERRRRWDQARSQGRLGPPTEELRRLLAGCGRDAGDELLAELVELDADIWRHCLRLYDDVLPTLDELRGRGCRLGLVSNCSWPTRPAIEHAGLTGRMDTVVLSCEVGMTKPDPALLRLALERLGAEAAGAVFVDDTGLYLDAGRELGLRTVQIHRSGAARADHHEAIADLRELASLLAG